MWNVFTDWRDLRQYAKQAGATSSYRPRSAFGITPSRLSCCTRRSDRSSKEQIVLRGYVAGLGIRRIKCLPSSLFG